MRSEPSSRPPRPVRCLQSLRLPFSTGSTTRTRRESPRERLCEFILSKSSAMSRWEMQVGEGGRAVDMRLPKRRFTDDEVAEQARKVRAALFPRVRAARMRAGSHTVPGAPARRTGESSRARAARRASAAAQRGLAPCRLSSRGRAPRLLAACARAAACRSRRRARSVAVGELAWSARTRNATREGLAGETGATLLTLPLLVRPVCVPPPQLPAAFDALGLTQPLLSIKVDCAELGFGDRGMAALCEALVAIRRPRMQARLLFYKLRLTDDSMPHVSAPCLVPPAGASDLDPCACVPGASRGAEAACALRAHSTARTRRFRVAHWRACACRLPRCCNITKAWCWSFTCRTMTSLTREQNVSWSRSPPPRPRGLACGGRAVGRWGDWLQLRAWRASSAASEHVHACPEPRGE